MNSLANELFLKIASSIEKHTDLLALKQVCKEYYTTIPDKYIIKCKLQNKINNFYHLNNCVNINCCEETRDLYENYYREYDGRYIHAEQPSMNRDTIFINQIPYKVYSPYCCECFKKYVMIGDKKECLVNILFCEDFVDIEYTDAKDYKLT